ncbi:ABC transporter substrate-binding protein [Xanthobacter aminoxidans]|uniref:ABC transporter substrate-binding protein n=1 Tax=Xanthobacter aminoxidans TaxID=186280 RepID=UPI002023123A|nr:ABC transporter substrate-binding protein [Xanthobacter aminoxidans]MCL8384107.1 ABC transporter substrate-binding protein [Xanthobacter aminoxidans]
MKTRRAILGLAAALALAPLLAAAPAQAEGVLRIAQQFGTLYTPFHVMKEKGLVEQHGKALGIDIKVEWIQLSGGSAVNDALLAGNIDIASAGIGPFLTLWDKTRGTSNAVKIVGAFGAQPNYLLTNNPDVKTIKDFTEKDKIAMPVAGVSVQARILQLAAEQTFGPGNAKKLDALMVTLPHPDATAALLSGSTEITGYLSNAPFQNHALKDPKIHKVFSSYDIFGGPVTPTVAYATVKFRQDNPKTYKAFLEAFEEATKWVEQNKKEAADIYVKVERSKLDPAFVAEVLSDPDTQYTLVPLGTLKFADFMNRIGAIKAKPTSFKDFTFEDLHSASGS